VLAAIAGPVNSLERRAVGRNAKADKLPPTAAATAATANAIVAATRGVGCAGK